jgi:hypothetical protein
MKNQCLLTLVMLAGLLTGPVVFSEETVELPKQVAYLGVATRSIDAGRGAGLGLGKGMGLEVTYVDPKGAVADTVNPRDVLTRLGDQYLVNPEQLAVLVQAKAVGGKVALTLIRDGKEQTVSATLRARSTAAARLQRPRVVPRMPRGFPDGLRDMDDWMRQDPDTFFREMMERMRESLGKSGLDEQTRLQMMNSMGAAFSNTADRVASPVAPLAGKWQSVLQKRSSVSLVDGDTTLTLSGEGDDDRHLTIKDAGDGVLFDGPVNTEAERKSVPEPYQAKLDRLQSLERRFKIQASPPAAAR